MAVQDDFRRAIIAQPDDDAPRLVYADWLDENDQAEQAAYIRESIALDRLPEYDPDRIALRVAAQRRWHKHHATWGPPLPEEVGRVEWRRGFLDAVTLTHDTLHLLGDLLQQHPIRVLQIGLNTVERDRSWSQTLEDQRNKKILQILQLTPQIGQLRRAVVLAQYFYEGGRNLTTFAHYGMSFAKLLTGLTVESTPFITAERLQIGAQHRLTRLEGPARDADIHLLGDYPLPHLTEIDWSRGNLTIEGIRSLIAAPWAARLETLNLSSCGLRPDAIRLLAEGVFPKLHTLRLPLNWVDRSSAMALLRSTGFPKLRYLDLADNDLYDADIAALVELPLLEQLHALDLRRNAIRRMAASALGNTQALPNLRYLNLADNLMGDEALRELLRHPHWPNLVSLDLRNNETKFEGLHALVHSTLLPQLRCLRLRVGTYGPPPVWSYLFENGPALEELDLHGSAIDSDDFTDLLRATIPPHLVVLNLNETQLRDPCAAALAKSPLAAQLGELHLTINFTAPAWKALAKSPLAEGLVLLDTKHQGAAQLQKVFGTRLT